jgi:hypothetical protein
MTAVLLSIEFGGLVWRAILARLSLPSAIDMDRSIGLPAPADWSANDGA